MFTSRGRKIAYDNIAAGSATGREQTIEGNTVSKVEIHGGGYRTSTSNGDEWHSNVGVGDVATDQAADGTVDGAALPENIVATATTGTVEKLG